MTNPQNSDLFANEPVTQHVWMDHCQFPIPPDRPASVGMLVQTVAGVLQPGGNPLRGCRVELTDVSADTFEIV